MNNEINGPSKGHLNIFFKIATLKVAVQDKKAFSDEVYILLSY